MRWQNLPGKLANRYRLAKQQSDRKALKKRAVVVHKHRTAKTRSLVYTRQQYTKQLAASRQASREDYELGPLAPRRHAGLRARPIGTLASRQLFSTPRRENVHKRFVERHWSVEKGLEMHGWKRVDRKGLAMALEQGQKAQNATFWEKNGQYYFKRDRVVIIRGPNVGKVGEIEAVNRKAHTARLKEINQAEVYNSRLKDTGNAPNGIISRDVPITLDDIRLVVKHPKHVTDPKTGKTHKVHEEVILDHMILRTSSRRISGGREDVGEIQRFVPGSERPLPQIFPEERRAKLINEDYGPDDTLRITSEEVSFLPSLVNVPMPTSVIDELRNKHSKLRKRHTEEYIAKVEAKEDKKVKKERSVAVMKTPLNEFNALARVALRSEAKRRINQRGSDEKIGEAVWKHLAAAAAREPPRDLRPRL